MPGDDPRSLTDEQEKLCREIDSRERRKLRSRSEPKNPSVGLRMFGMVGWSVAMPTMIGLALGRFIDGRTGGPGAGGPSWTLTMLVVGVVAGCLNAWFWVAREGRLDKESNDHDDGRGGHPRA